MTKPLQFTRVHQVRLHEQILTRFREMAEAGVLQPGDRLPPERELLQQLGVSRQVLREAFTVMESQGMVTTTPGGGRVFRGHGSGDASGLIEALQGSALIEILTAREAVECKLAELAAVRAGPDDIAALRARIAELRSQDYTFEWNSGFHLAIAATAGNDVLENLLQLLIEARRDVYQSDYLTHDQLTRLFQDHAAIVDALETHDPLRAREAMRRHIATTIEVFERRVAERSGPTAKRAVRTG